MITRRELLAGLGGAAVMAVAPLARAASTARARRVLVVHLGGGVRSSAAFLASDTRAFNPWGRIPGVKLPLGRVLDDHVEREAPPNGAIYTLRTMRGARLPRLREITDRFLVVGTWDPERGDHSRSERVAFTGSAGSAAGLLVRLAGALSETARPAETPPSLIGAQSSLAFAPPALARFAALEIGDSRRIPGAVEREPRVAERNGRDFAIERLDEEYARRMGPAAREIVDTYGLHQRMGRKLGEMLASPAVNLGRETDPLAALGKLRSGRPLTNEMLLEATYLPTRLGGEQNAGIDLALAVRLLQIGSPAVAVSLGNYDLHSGERTGAPRLYRALGAAWSSLYFLLGNIADPLEPDASLLDRTLVLTLSEFGRDPGQPRTGFNGGEGSDHGAHPACYYLAHAVMGAGVTGGRVAGGVNTDSYDARKEPVRYGPRQLLATALYALGIDPQHPRWSFDGASPIEELWRA